MLVFAYELLVIFDQFAVLLINTLLIQQTDVLNTFCEKISQIVLLSAT